MEKAIAASCMSPSSLPPCLPQGMLTEKNIASEGICIARRRYVAKQHAKGKDLKAYAAKTIKPVGKHLERAKSMDKKAETKK